MKLWVDEGHGGPDSGAVGGGYVEDTRNLTVGNEIERLAKARGWTVGDTRDTDVSATLLSRYERANAWGAEVFVSVHHDWIGGEQAVIYPDSNNTREIASQRLADVINKHIDPLAPTQSVIYADRRGLAVLRGTHMPAVIVEVSRVQDPYSVTAMAEAVIAGLAEYAGEDEPMPTEYKVVALEIPVGDKACEEKIVAIGKAHGHKVFELPSSRPLLARLADWFRIDNR